MALQDTAHYVNFGDGSTTGYYAVTKRPQNSAVVAGVLARQFTTPSVGNERVFVCIVAGTTANTTDATWTLTRGAKITDGGATWQECTGLAGLNGDTTNTAVWALSQTWTLGQLIYDSGTSSLQICSTAGAGKTTGSPTFSATAGVTASDNVAVWTSLGAASGFSGGAAPHARLSNCLTVNWAQAGNTVWAHSASQESQSTGVALVGAGTNAKPIAVYCHNGSNYPPGDSNRTTGASITVTGIVALQVQGNLYVDGMTFNATVNAGSVRVAYNGVAIKQKLVNCSLVLGGTSGSSSFIYLGGNSGSFDLVNTTMSFNNAAQGIAVALGDGRWLDTPSAINGTAPTNLINEAPASNQLDLLIQGVDLSGIGTGKTLVGTIGGNAFSGNIQFQNCKLPSSTTLSNTPANSSYRISMIDCDSGGGHRTELFDFAGTMTTETTVTRTGGASDGTTSFSRKVVTTANCSWLFPLESMPIAIWNDTTGSAKTVTLYGIWGGGSVPNNDQFWMDVEYMGDSGSPVSSRSTSTKASNLASSSALSSDSSIWGGSTTPFKTTVTITPQQKGFIYVFPKMADPSTTFYYDPEITVT